APQLPGPFRARARTGFTPGRRLSGRRRVRVLFLFVVVIFLGCAEYSSRHSGCQPYFGTISIHSCALTSPPFSHTLPWLLMSSVPFADPCYVAQTFHRHHLLYCSLAAATEVSIRFRAGLCRRARMVGRAGHQRPHRRSAV